MRQYELIMGAVAKIVCNPATTTKKTTAIAMDLSVYGTWSGLPDEIASELFASATSCQLKAGDTLFQTGDKGDGCYRLDVGLLKVSLISPQVKERIIAIITPGVVVGDLAMIDGLPRSASVNALTDCELRFLSRAAFERLAEDHPEIHKYLVKLLAARLRQADENIASLAFLSAKARVAYALLALAENLGEETDSGASPDPPDYQSRRHRRDGRGRPRECKPDLE